MSMLYHYLPIGITVGVTTVGVGIGSGLIGLAALKAAKTQPSARHDIIRTAFLGMALSETAAVLNVAIAFIVLIGGVRHATDFPFIGEIGIACALTIAGFTVGIASALPAQAACASVARQPFFSNKITRLMLLCQTMIQTPIIFSFIIAIAIKSQIASVADLPNALRLIASGLCVGLGGIGPAIGLGLFGRAAMRGIGFNRLAYNKIFSFSIVSQAMIETPAIFALISAIPMLSATQLTENHLLTAIAFIAAACLVGLATLTTGISSGRTAAAACTALSYNPDLYTALSRVSILGQGFIDTYAIYGLIVSLGLIFLT